MDKCAVCGKKIKQGNGRPRIYCSNKCRSKAYRIRLKRVLEAFKAGYAVKMEPIS